MKPIWADLSHHEKFLQLHENRSLFCSNYVEGKKGQSGQEYILDGCYIEDIPSFYLLLGEAVNGKYGYFGACLDSLEDCLGGDFGAVYPFDVHIINGERVEKSLNDVAWARWHFEKILSRFDDGGCSYDGLIEDGVFEPIDFKGKSYFKEIEIIFDGRIKLYD